MLGVNHQMRNVAFGIRRHSALTPAQVPTNGLLGDWEQFRPLSENKTSRDLALSSHVHVVIIEKAKLTNQT